MILCIPIPCYLRGYYIIVGVIDIMDDVLRCPKCKSKDIYFSKKSKQYRCEDCNELFDKPIKVEPNRKYTINTWHIKAFLASSIKLTQERDLISSIVAESNGKDYNTYVELSRCEYDNRIQMNSSQQEMYDCWINESDVFILIVSESGIGEWTENEVAIAVEMKKTRKIKLHALVQHGAETGDAVENKRWEKALSAYKDDFDSITEYSSISELYDNAKKLIEDIRCDDEIDATMITDCQRIGYDVVITGVSDKSKEFVYLLADKFNKKNNENFCENEKESLIFNLKLIVNDSDDIEKYLVDVNDYYFILAGRSKDIKNRIGQCYQARSGNPYTFFDVSVFEADPESSKIMNEISGEINGNYLSMFLNRDALFGKNSINDRMEEIKRAYQSFQEGLSYYYSGDYFNAEELLIRAAKFGFKDACFSLGVIYSDESKPDFLNLPKAIEYYRSAADYGDPDAQFNLANLLNKNKEWEPAEKYYLMAADQNYPAASYNLGLMLYNMGDLDRAEEYLSNMFWTNVEDREDNKATAFPLLAKVLEENGNESDAYYILRQRAACSDAEAQYRLGIFLEKTGSEHTHYIEEAERYYRSAADQGHEGAQQALAKLLQKNGQHEEAEKYLQMAGNHEYKDLDLNVMLESTTDKTAKWEHAGDPVSQLSTAIRFKESGNITQAKKYYKLAALNNNWSSIGSRYSQAVHTAQLCLGDLLIESGCINRGEAYLHLAENCSFPFIVDSAKISLKNLRAKKLKAESERNLAEAVKLKTECDELIAQKNQLVTEIAGGYLQPSTENMELSDEILEKSSPEILEKLSVIIAKGQELTAEITKRLDIVEALTNEIKKLDLEIQQ